MSFYHLLTDYVWYAPPAGVDNYGDASFGEWVKISAAVEHGSSKVYDSNGSEAISTTSFAHAVEIPDGSKIVLSETDKANAAKQRTAIFSSKVPSRIRDLVIYETFL